MHRTVIERIGVYHYRRTVSSPPRRRSIINRVFRETAREWTYSRQRVFGKPAAILFEKHATTISLPHSLRALARLRYYLRNKNTKDRGGGSPSSGETNRVEEEQKVATMSAG